MSLRFAICEGRRADPSMTLRIGGAQRRLRFFDGAQGRRRMIHRPGSPFTA